MAGKTDRRLLLPVSEVARMLGVSRSTVTRACDAGEIPVVFLRKRLVPRAFVESLVKAASPGHPVVAKEHAAAWSATVPAEAVAS